MNKIQDHQKVINDWVERNLTQESAAGSLSKAFEVDGVIDQLTECILAGRNPKNDFIMEGNRVGFTNFGEGVFIIDPYTGEHRETTKQDVADSAKTAERASAILQFVAIGLVVIAALFILMAR